MESPSIWNLLAASLAVCDLERPAPVWAFLIVQGLVRDEPGDREMFVAIVSKERARGEITGPSVALRAAAALEDAGIVLPAGLTADPWGAVALRRVDTLAKWGFPRRRPGRRRTAKMAPRDHVSRRKRACARLGYGHQARGLGGDHNTTRAACGRRQAATFHLQLRGLWNGIRDPSY